MLSLPWSILNHFTIITVSFLVSLRTSVRVIFGAGCRRDFWISHVVTPIASQSSMDKENASGCDALTGFGRPRQPHAVVYWIDTEISVLTPALSWLYSCVRACAWRHSRRSATWLDRAAPPRAQQAPLSTRAAHCTQNLGEGYIYKFQNRQRIGLPLVIW
jgi:hypothetical protein